MKKIIVILLLNIFYIINVNALWWDIWIPSPWNSKIYTNIDNNIEWPYSYLDYKETSNWVVFSYIKNDLMYINIYWKVYWPYTYVKLYDYWNNWYIYTYKLDWKSYLNINWEINWPYNYDIISLEISDKSYYYNYYQGSDRYINLDWNIYWPINNDFRFFDLWENNKAIFYWYDNTYNFYINNELISSNYIYFADKLDNQLYYYKYKINNDFYINIKWKDYWPYSDINNIKALWKEWFIFSYYNKGMYYYNINWKEFWEYWRINSLETLWENYLIVWIKDTWECAGPINRLTWKCVKEVIKEVNYNGNVVNSWDNSDYGYLYEGWYAYTYSKIWSKGWLIINWEDSKDNNSYSSIDIRKINNNNWFFFIYSLFETGNKKYININWKEYWPYDSIDLNNIYSNDNWVSFLYNIWQNAYVYTNWKDYWPYDWVNLDNLYSDYNWNIGYFLYKNNNNFYININWKEYWPYINYIRPDISDLWFSYIWEKEDGLYFNLNWNIIWPYNWDIWDLKLNINWYSYWDRIKSLNVGWYSQETFILKENSSVVVNYKIKANPKIDLLLNKIFYKIDKKWKDTANKIYQSLIDKINNLLTKKQNQKNIELLEYIKYKVEEKLK